MLTGQLLEQLPRADIRTVPATKAAPLATPIYALGCAAIFAPWVVLLCYFFQAGDSSDIPAFVYAAFLGTLVLFTTFAVNSYLHHIMGQYDFHTAEVRKATGGL